MTEIAVCAKGISKRFGETLALDGVSVDVCRGEFFSLLGSSGCGKTTLLRIIGGFESPDSGDILIEGKSVLRVPPYQRSTNMIFQHLALFPHLSVAQNIAFGMEVKKRPADEIARKTSQMLDLVRLGGYENRGIDMLSGGQKQRVAIARALVNEPDVLLLDEPLGALDLQLRLQMHEELKRIHREIGSTFIFVTHDQGEAITLSDRIAVMEGGKIVQLGTPREIYERPQVRFVAEFVGHANFIFGEVVSPGDGNGCFISANGITYEGIATSQLDAGSKVLAIIRYEKVELLMPGEPGDGLPCRVVDAIYRGSIVRISLRADSGLDLICELPSTQANSAIESGQNVRAKWARDHLVVMPA